MSKWTGDLLESLELWGMADIPDTRLTSDLFQQILRPLLFILKYQRWVITQFPQVL